MSTSPEHRQDHEKKERLSKTMFRMAGAVALFGFGLHMITDAFFPRH